MSLANSLPTMLIFIIITIISLLIVYPAICFLFGDEKDKKWEPIYDDKMDEYIAISIDKIYDGHMFDMGISPEECLDVFKSIKIYEKNNNLELQEVFGPNRGAVVIFKKLEQ